MNSILIIEDDEILRENTAELLELSGYTVKTAPNGKKGIELAMRYLPDLIICDIMMPEMDGYEVLSALTENENTQFIPFIFLSAKTKHQEVRKGMDLGADDYLTKPFREEDLLKSVRTRLQKAGLFNEKIRTSHSPSEKKTDDVRSLNQLKKLFSEKGEHLNLKKNEMVYEKGGHSNQIYLILDGLIKTHIIDRNGKELITGLYKPDDFLGFTSFEGNLTYKESATCMQKTELIGLSKEYLKDILQENQEVSLEFVNLLTDNLSEIKTQLIRMAYSSVRKKTASTIIRFSELMEDSQELAIRVSRNDLAANAGIAPESLIRTLSDFKKDGLIEIEGRTIRILDLEGLQNTH